LRTGLRYLYPFLCTFHYPFPFVSFLSTIFLPLPSSSPFRLPVFSFTFLLFHSIIFPFSGPSPFVPSFLSRSSCSIHFHFFLFDFFPFLHIYFPFPFLALFFSYGNLQWCEINLEWLVFSL